MECVEAIRDRHLIQEMKQVLYNHSKRDYLLFVFGINTGLKISEILTLKISEVLNIDGTVKNFHESKDGNFIYLNQNLKDAILAYQNDLQLPETSYLFNSAKTNQPITRQQAYRIINNAAKKVGIEGKIGTHSMRKTFGYHAYKRGVAISILQKLFHHSTPSETLKYLGIQKGETIKTEIDVAL